jgi:hypothetical protein
LFEGRNRLLVAFRVQGLKVFVGSALVSGPYILFMLEYVLYSDLNIMLIFSLEGLLIGDNMSKNKPIVVGCNTYTGGKNHA